MKLKHLQLHRFFTMSVRCIFSTKRGGKFWAIENQGLVEIVDFSNTPLDEEQLGYLSFYA